jgi:hypothetical protein
MHTQSISVEPKALTQIKVLGTRCGIVFGKQEQMPTSGRVLIEASGSAESLSLFVEIMLQRGIVFSLFANQNP